MFERLFRNGGEFGGALVGDDEGPVSCLFLVLVVIS